MENIEDGSVVTRYFPFRKRNLLIRMTQMSTYEHMNLCLSFKNVRMRFTNGILENSFTIILENCKQILTLFKRDHEHKNARMCVFDSIMRALTPNRELYKKNLIILLALDHFPLHLLKHNDIKFQHFHTSNLASATRTILPSFAKRNNTLREWRK